MKLSKGEQTKIRIMTVATDLFLKNGLYDVTFQKIADGADLSQPAIYRHFQDMDELILESCKHWINEFREFKTRPTTGFEPAKQQLEHFFERHLAYASKNRAKDALLFGLYYYSMRSKNMMQFYLEIKNRALLKIKTILHLGNQDGSWTITDLDETTNTIHSIIVGEVIKFLIEPHAEDQSERVKRVKKHVKNFLK